MVPGQVEADRASSARKAAVLKNGSHRQAVKPFRSPPGLETSQTLLGKAGVAPRTSKVTRGQIILRDFQLLRLKPSKGTAAAPPLPSLRAFLLHLGSQQPAWLSRSRTPRFAPTASQAWWTPRAGRRRALCEHAPSKAAVLSS